MANGDGAEQHVDKEWQKLIFCSICNDFFTDPKTISCLHTFCKQCIAKETESRAVLCCPLCQSPISLPKDDVSSLPTDHATNRLVETFRKVQKEKNKCLALKETGCSRCDIGIMAIAWCKVPCNGWLCEHCYDSHKRMKDFINHETITVEELINDPKLLLNFEPIPPEATCKSHNQLLDRYCKTCHSLICHDCTLKDHPHETHDYDLIDKEREKITEATNPLTKLLEQVRNVVKSIEDIEKEIDNKSEENTRRISSVYDEIYKILMQQQQEAVQNVNTIKMSFKEALIMQKENAKFMEGQLMRCKDFSDNAILTNLPQHLLTCRDLIIARVEDLTKQAENTSIHPKFRADDIMVQCGNPNRFICDSVCHVSTIPYLPHCRVRGPLAISNPVKITVALTDIHGFSVVEQSTNLEIRSNKEEDFLQNVRIEEESKGIYHIWYNPKSRQTHLLSVYWRGLALDNKVVNVPVKIRDYVNIKQEARVIKKYGQSNKELKWPIFMAKGLNNEIIVRGYSACELVVFDEKLQYSHVIGEKGDGNGSFEMITGIAVDKRGFLYVADCGLNCIQKFTMEGKFIYQFGSDGTAEGRLRSPFGLAISHSDHLFVCDRDNHRIHVFKNGLFSHLFGKNGEEDGEFNCPHDVTLNSYEDLLFITDTKNNRIQVFTLSGIFLTKFGDLTGIPFKLLYPFGIHYTPDNHLMVCFNSSNCVLIFQEDGKFVSAIEDCYQGKTIFSFPCGIIMTDDGQIVIASYGTDEMVVF